MNDPSKMKIRIFLLLGDALVVGAVTLYGFAAHEELGTAGWRMLTTFLPLLAAWLMIAPHLQVFVPERAADYRQLWRPFLAAWFAAPMAGWLRAIWLGTAVVPVFILVLAGVSSIGLLIWRGLACLYLARKQFVYG
jgi:hypothetical protein